MTTIGVSAFDGNEFLESVTIPDSVKTIKLHAFMYCKKLTDVSIGSGVTALPTNAFFGCDSLKTITIPQGVTSIGTDAFAHCPNMTTIYFEGTTEPTCGESVFYLTSSIVIVPSTYSSDSFCSAKTAKKTSDGTAVRTESCGSNCQFSLEATSGQVTISGSGKMTDWQSTLSMPWYSYRKSMKKVVVGNDITSIGMNTFYISNIEEATIGTKVETIGINAFVGCSSLKTITIPASVKTIGSAAFEQCMKLTKITVDSQNTAFSNDNSGVLFDKEKTLLIQYPLGNKQTSYSIPSSVETLRKNSFYFAELKQLTISKSVKTIEDYAISYLPLLEKYIVNQENEAFSSDSHGVLFNKEKTTIIHYPMGNPSKSYEIPETVETINYSAFSSASQLTSIVIPDSVETINNYAFSKCEQLQSVVFEGNEEPKTCSNSAFNDCDLLTIVYVPQNYTSTDFCGLNVGDQPEEIPGTIPDHSVGCFILSILLLFIFF